MATMTIPDRMIKNHAYEETVTVLREMPLHGEICTWAIGTVEIRYADLLAALRDADLDEKVARELLPRHAFARACRKLAHERVIDQIDDAPSTITFQFTARTWEDRPEGKRLG